jgi:hypothetical protein
MGPPGNPGRFNLLRVKARQEQRGVFVELIRAPSIESSEKAPSHQHFFGLARVDVGELNERLESALSQQTIQFRLVEEALVEVPEPPTGRMFRIPMRIAIDVEEVKRGANDTRAPLEIEARNVVKRGIPDIATHRD